MRQISAYDVAEAVCYQPLVTVNASTAAVVRSITEDPPTIMVDEADTIFGTKKAADNNEDARHPQRGPST